MLVAHLLLLFKFWKAAFYQMYESIKKPIDMSSNEQEVKVGHKISANICYMFNRLVKHF